MTIASEIQTITDYNSTDVTNAVTEATSYAAQYNSDDDEIIKSIAIWLLERQTAERQNRTDSTVAIPSIVDLHKFIRSLMIDDDDVVDIIVTKNTSPRERNKKGWYDT